MARRVIFIAKYLPPTGGAGVHRSLGTVRHLREHGYEPAVITGPGTRVDRWGPSDPGLLGRIPAETELHRLEGPEPEPPTGRRDRMHRLLRRQPAGARWWVDGAVRAGERVGTGAELILCSGNPYESVAAGARLSQRLGIPWVVDLEDPWALDEMRVHATALHRRADLRWMRRSIATAAAVVMCTDESALRVSSAFPELAGRIVTSIPIGFDRDDFPPERREPRDRDIFRIVHTGSLHTELGLRHRQTTRGRRMLRGSSLDVDILSRSPVFLLQAVEALLASEPELRGRIEVHLAGELTPGDRAAVDSYTFVRTPGLLPHAQTLSLMRSADLLFLPMHDVPQGRAAGIVPYKTYEYLAAERPILAAVPDGDTRRILSGIGHAVLCRPKDVDAMAAAIRTAVRRGPVEAVEDGMDSPALAPYERRAAVAAIAHVLDEVLEGLAQDVGAPRRSALLKR